MAAKDKNDIMDALLKGSSGDAAPETSSFARLIHRERKTKGAKQPAANALSTKPESKKAPAGDSKKKSTHYLSEEIFADLDDAREKINELVRQRLKTRVSKSRIVDQALRMILKEFEEKGEKSPLIKALLKNSHQK